MRNADDVYWTTSLPKHHQALQTLDVYCQEWGGLSRAEATRRLLIEWDKVRRGEASSGWTQLTPSPQKRGDRGERGQQEGTTVIHPSSFSGHAAQAANRDLDD